MWSCECDLVGSFSVTISFSSLFPMEECVETNSLTQAEEDIEAARLLIHLSTVILGSAATTLHEDDHNNHSSNSNSNSVEWMTKGGAGADVSLWFSEEKEEEIIEDVLADIEDDESLRRKNKRYRYLDDLYRVTLPLVGVTAGNKSNKFICRDSHINIIVLQGE